GGREGTDARTEVKGSGVIRSMTMKAWRLDRLGGELRFEDVPMPEVRPGSILVRIEASTLMSYIKPYVEGRLPSYHVAEGGFTPGGNCVGS
ncbi:MAG: hypothetical protein WAV18_04255, partial [Roseiarcus sp.]